MKLNNNITILKWFNFFLDFKLYAPITIIYFTSITHSYALGMSIFSVMMISSALLEIPTGVISDRIGRKNTVIAGAISGILFTLFYAIGHNYAFLAIGAVLQGLSASFYSGNNDALLHDTLSEEKQEHLYGEQLGKISAMFQIALAISAVLGGIIGTWSLSLLLWLSIIPQVICLFLAMKLREPKLHLVKSSSIISHLSEATTNFVKNEKIRLMSLASVWTSIGEASYTFQAAFFASLWPIWAIGAIKALGNIMAAYSFHFSGAIIKRFGTFKILTIQTIYNRSINALATAFPSVLSPLLMTSTSLFFGVTMVANNAYLQKEFKPEQRATMSSLNSFAGSLFFGLTAILLGSMADQLTPARAILLLQIVQLVSLLFFWRLARIEKNN